MKWMKQFGIILLISFVGEILEKWIPLPIPASIYGIILLFLCLKLNIIPHEAVHETGKFLIEIMPLMFIPAAVGLLETWDVIAPAWLEYVAVKKVSLLFSEPEGTGQAGEGDGCGPERCAALRMFVMK